MKYLDDIDPKEITDEQREQLRDLCEHEPYAFYSL